MGWFANWNIALAPSTVKLPSSGTTTRPSTSASCLPATRRPRSWTLAVFDRFYILHRLPGWTSISRTVSRRRGAFPVSAVLVDLARRFVSDCLGLLLISLSILNHRFCFSSAQLRRAFLSRASETKGLLGL